MPYNTSLSRSDVATLIPPDISFEILKAVPQASAAMRYARKLANMSRAQRRMPVMTALATAYFVNGDTGLKQTTTLNWEGRYIDAEELAVIVPIPEAVLDDSGFDIWGEAQPALVEAFGVAIDQAVFYGTNIPATWTTNLAAAGLYARCVAAGHNVSLAAYTDLYEAVLGESAAAKGMMMLIEEDGFVSSGMVAHVSMRGKIRNTRDADGLPIWPNVNEIDGSPVSYPANGSMDSATSLMFAGDWSQLVYSMRQDITYKILTEAVIQDASGNIVYNLAQQDMVALRAVMRLGFALPNPINRMNPTELTRCQFAVLTA